MRCEEIMRRHLETVRASDSVERAAQIMRDSDVGILPVCDEAGVVLGVVTDRDLALRVCAQNRASAETRVGAVMTPDVVARRPGHSVGRAETLMAKYRKSRVLVTDDEGRLVGIVSVSDIVQYETPARLTRTMYAIAARKFRPESP